MQVCVSHSQFNRQEKQTNNDENIAFVIRAGYNLTHSLSCLRQFLICHPLKIYLAASFQADFLVITTKQSIHISDTMAADIK